MKGIKIMSFFTNLETDELDCRPITELKLIGTKYRSWNSLKFNIINEQNFDVCSDCGEVINKDTDDYDYTADDELICNSCYEDYYFTCEDCGNIYHIDDCITIHSGWDREVSFVCQNCADNNYYKCDECGYYYIADCTTTDANNTTYCYHCQEYNNYEICEGCNCWTDSGEYSEINDCYYCPDCFPENTEIIHTYGYAPNLEFYSMQDETVSLYFGLELETAGNRDCAENFLNYFDADQVYLTNDSSIKPEGFEITTHPMSYNYLTNSNFTKQLEAGLNYLKTQDFKGHNAGGIHIHISRAAVNPAELICMKHIIYNDPNSLRYKTLLKITQRHNKELMHWADMRTEKMHADTKYTAINLQHYSTIEFRIFNSNLRIERVLKNIEFIKLLIDFSRLYAAKDWKQNIYEVLHYAALNADKYPHFIDFCIENKIIKQSRCFNYQQKLAIAA